MRTTISTYKPTGRQLSYTHQIGPTPCPAPSREHPWEGRPQHAFGLTAGRTFDIVSTGMFLFIATICFLLLSQTAFGQTGVGSSESATGHSHQITADALEVAEDYADLLQELHLLINDYSKYFAMRKIESTAGCRKSLEELTKNLDTDTYLTSLGDLRTDLSQLSAELHELVLDLGIKKKHQKTQKLARTLQREIMLLQKGLAEQLTQSLTEQTIHYQEIRMHVLEQLASDEFLQAMEEFKELKITVIKRGDSGVMMIIPPDAPDAEPLVIDLPSIIGGAPIVVGRADESDNVAVIVSVPNIDRMNTQGLVIEPHSLSASYRVPSESVTIEVVNPTGELRISGSYDNEITAYYDIEILAATERKAHKIARKVDLRIHKQGEKIVVEARLPDISDPDTRIIRSELVVSVPSNNILSCTNSFGPTEVIDMDDDVKIEANYSDVTIGDCGGSVSVTNNMGKVEITDCDGSISVENSFSSITITGCTGDISIESSLAEIDISDCDGNLDIVGKGNIRISEHSGSIMVQNSNGFVMLSEISGDVNVVNSFGMITVEQIYGSAVLENANSPIDAREITGSLTADNQYGAIRGRSLSGPINLRNKSGLISLVLNESLSGPSTITSTSGVVDMLLSSDSDLHLLTTVVGGNIQSAFPIDVSVDGKTKTAVLSLGRGSSALTIYGTDSRIVLNKTN